MGTLEKILEEIDAHSIEFEMFGVSDDYISVGWVKEIIRKHMNDGWIPVEERLPEDEEMVLVTCKTKVGRLSVYRAWRGGGYWHGTGSISDVIAWQPLPEPYRPEKEEGRAK